MANETTLTVEEMAKRRTNFLMLALVFGGIWQVTQIVDALTNEGRTLSTHLFPWLLLVQMLGWLGWIVSLVRLMSWGKIVKAHPQLAMALDDEFYQQVRARSFTHAFAAGLVCQAVLIAIATFYPFSALVGADITIFVMCTTAFVSFLLLERQ